MIAPCGFLDEPRDLEPQAEGRQEGENGVRELLISSGFSGFAALPKMRNSAG